MQSIISLIASFNLYSFFLLRVRVRRSRIVWPRHLARVRASFRSVAQELFDSLFPLISVLALPFLMPNFSRTLRRVCRCLAARSMAQSFNTFRTSLLFTPSVWLRLIRTRSAIIYPRILVPLINLPTSSRREANEKRSRSSRVKNTELELNSEEPFSSEHSPDFLSLSRFCRVSLPTLLFSNEGHRDEPPSEIEAQRTRMIRRNSNLLSCGIGLTEDAERRSMD